MAVYLSPGVYVNEKDLSTYAEALSTVTVVMFGTASKGPVGEPVFVSSQRSLVDTFGIPLPDDYGLYSMLQFLRYGSMAYYVRVTDGTESVASITLNNTAATPLPILTLKAKTPGTWGNALSVLFREDSNANHFFEVIDNDEVVESLLLEDTTGDSVVNQINKDSQYIVAEKLADFTLTDVISIDPHVLTGGANGDTNIEDSHYIGALSSISNPEQIDFNHFAIPGVSSGAVINEAISLATQRGDCMFVVDPPMGLTVSEVIDWHNGTGSYSDHSAFNSSYAVLYWSWLKVYDSYYNRDLWLPPSGFVLGAYAYNDSVGAIFNAPAGLNRGRLLEPLAVEYSPDKSERDILYSSGNNVNPIVNIAGEGITIYGQKTLARKPSWLQKLHARRLALYLEKVIATSSRYFVFEQNNPDTWRQWLNMVNPVFAKFKRDGGLEDYLIKMDESTNTSLNIMNGEMVGELHFIPTGVAEKVVLNFVLHASGASFE